MRLTLPRILAVVVVVLLVVGAVVLIASPGKYRVTAIVPAINPNILEGSRFLVNGFQKGTVESFKPVADKVELNLTVDSDFAPLHTGAFVFTQFQSAVGDRLLAITDGPRTNPEIPDGGRIEGNFPKPMEISDTLSQLDPATRNRLAPLAASLQRTLAGSEQDVNKTLRAAGPAFTAIGNLTKGLSIDGPALTQLVNDTNKLLSRINTRSADLSGIITDFDTTTRDTAAVRTQLRQTLQKLPPTLDQANSTLAKVPDTVDATVPLLEDLRPATDRLPSVANNLAPVLRDLRPTISELKPTLKALDDLLGETPSLLDQARSTIPKTTETFDNLTPTLKTLRPFTPCLVATFSNVFSGQWNNGEGQNAGILVRAGAQSFNGNPAGLPGLDGLLTQNVPTTCDPYGQSVQKAGTLAGTTTSGSASAGTSALTGGLN